MNKPESNPPSDLDALIAESVALRNQAGELIDALKKTRELAKLDESRLDETLRALGVDPLQ